MKCCECKYFFVFKYGWNSEVDVRIKCTNKNSKYFQKKIEKDFSCELFEQQLNGIYEVQVRKYND